MAVCASVGSISSLCQNTSRPIAPPWSTALWSVAFCGLLLVVADCVVFKNTPPIHPIGDHPSGYVQFVLSASFASSSCKFRDWKWAPKWPTWDGARWPCCRAAHLLWHSESPPKAIRSKPPQAPHGLLADQPVSTGVHPSQLRLMDKPRLTVSVHPSFALAAPALAHLKKENARENCLCSTLALSASFMALDPSRMRNGFIRCVFVRPGIFMGS